MFGAESRFIKHLNKNIYLHKANPYWVRFFRVNSIMDYQILVNVAVGVVTLMGGWVFKMLLGHVNEIKDEHNDLMKKHHEDVEKITSKYTDLALSLPEKYVSKEDFKMFSERMNDRFDRLEEKIDNLKTK